MHTFFYNKKISWSHDKNETLKQGRDISFEEIEEVITSNTTINILPHPNTEKYPHQHIILVKIHGKIYITPCVADEEKVFLKTIYPSSKATKKYQ